MIPPLPEGRLIYVSLPYATYGLIVSNERVVFAPPIARWMIGKHQVEVVGWLRRRNARIVPLE